VASATVGSEPCVFSLCAARSQQGTAIARTLEDPHLGVVAEVIEPNERTCFASQRAADALCQYIRSAPNRVPAHEALVHGLQRAHGDVFEPGERSSSIFALAGAVSLASFLLEGNRVVVANIGNCRCYLVRDRQLTCLDKGHCASDAIGGSSREGKSILGDQDRDLVTEALGLREKIHPHRSAHELVFGDRLLLCTSAVWSTSSETALLAAVSEPSTVEDACERVANLCRPGDAFAVALAHVDAAARSRDNDRVARP
jgi:serine/threonine protein phosphatase PrpC